MHNWIRLLVVLCISSPLLAADKPTILFIMSDGHGAREGRARVADPGLRCNGFCTAATFGAPFAAATAVEATCSYRSGGRRGLLGNTSRAPTLLQRTNRPAGGSLRPGTLPDAALFLSNEISRTVR